MQTVHDELGQIIDNLLLIKNNTDKISSIEKDILLQNLREAYLAILRYPVSDEVEVVENQEEKIEEPQKESVVEEVVEEKVEMQEEEQMEEENEEMDIDILEFVKENPSAKKEDKNPIRQETRDLFTETEPMKVTEPEPVVEIKPEPVKEAAPEPVVTPKPEPIPEPVPEPKPAVEVKPEPVKVVESEPVIEVKPEPVKVTESEPVVEAAPEPVVMPKPEPIPEPIPESKPAVEVKPELVKVVEPEPVVEVKPEPVIVTESEPVKEAASEPMAEVPFQSKVEAKPKQRSLNDLFNEQKQDLGEKFQQTKIADLTKAMSINDKFLFIRELFKNKSEEFSHAIHTLNKCENIEEAFDTMEGLKKQYFWDSTSSAYLALCDLVRRKF